MSFSPAQRAPDLAFDRTIAPGQRQACHHRFPIAAQSLREAPQGGDLARMDAGHPGFQGGAFALASDPKELLDQFLRMLDDRTLFP